MSSLVGCASSYFSGWRVRNGMFGLGERGPITFASEIQPLAVEASDATKLPLSCNGVLLRSPQRSPPGRLRLHRQLPICQCLERDVIDGGLYDQGLEHRLEFASWRCNDLRRGMELVQRKRLKDTEMRGLTLAFVLLMAAGCAVACGDDQTDSGAGGASGEAGQAAGRTGAGGGSPGGRAGGGTVAGGSATSGGVSGGGGAPAWSCGDDYQLDSYTGSTQGLCPAFEALTCCLPGQDQNAAVAIRCAPDGSMCLESSYCDDDLGRDCGWHFCPPEGYGATDSNGGAAGVAGGGTNAGEGGALANDPCPPDKIRAVEEGVAPPLCASDSQCPEGTVCNQRHGNRMFCGLP